MWIKFDWVRVRVHVPLIPVLILDQVDQGYWVIRSWCESVNMVASGVDKVWFGANKGACPIDPCFDP